jgi:hypothetical protein
MRYLADVKGGMHAGYGATIGTIGTTLNDHETNRAQQALDCKGEYGFRKMLEALVGVAPGAQATYSYPEIAASAELGGLRPVVNTNLINRVTTAADVADIKNALTSHASLRYTTSPIYNGDRNPLGSR